MERSWSNSTCARPSNKDNFFMNGTTPTTPLTALSRFNSSPSFSICYGSCSFFFLSLFLSHTRFVRFFSRTTTANPMCARETILLLPTTRTLKTCFFSRPRQRFIANEFFESHEMFAGTKIPKARTQICLHLQICLGRLDCSIFFAHFNTHTFSNLIARIHVFPIRF